MDRTVGQEAVVTGISDGDGIELNIDYMDYPFFVLEVIKKTKDDKMIDIDGKKWSKDAIKEALRKHAK